MLLDRIAETPSDVENLFKAAVHFVSNLAFMAGGYQTQQTQLTDSAFSLSRAKRTHQGTTETPSLTQVEPSTYRRPKSLGCWYNVGSISAALSCLVSFPEQRLVIEPRYNGATEYS